MNLLWNQIALNSHIPTLKDLQREEPVGHDPSCNSIKHKVQQGANHLIYGEFLGCTLAGKHSLKPHAIILAGQSIAIITMLFYLSLW